MTPLQRKTAIWLANGRVGESSRTMALWLAFGEKPDWPSHPHDPDDFDRCLRLLQWVPEMRDELHRMAAVSPVWAALVERWSEIEGSHLTEVGLGWTKGRVARRTYDLMRSIIDPIEIHGTVTVNAQR